MITDYHSHILPDFDDGADNLETALSMIEKMKSQGVERIIATPHFYAHHENSVNDYIERRQTAYDLLMKSSPAVKDIRLGAEVAIEKDISKLENLEKLAIAESGYILLELPFINYSKWIADEIYNISYKYKLKIILAHIHRYRNIYSKKDMEEILDMGAVLQVNNGALKNFGDRMFVKNLIKNDFDIIFGSDSHNMTTRPPDWNITLRRMKSDIIEKSNNLIL